MKRKTLTLKVTPTTPECELSEHHANGDWVKGEVKERGKFGEVIAFTCMSCGERWFVKIKDR